MSLTTNSKKESQSPVQIRRTVHRMDQGAKTTRFVLHPDQVRLAKSIDEMDGKARGAINIHALDTAKSDDISVGFRRTLAEFKRVTDEIGKVLNFRLLVIMRENDSIAFFFQPLDFSEQIKALQVFAGRWGVHAVIPLPCRTYSGS